MGKDHRGFTKVECLIMLGIFWLVTWGVSRRVNVVSPEPEIEAVTFAQCQSAPYVHFPEALTIELENLVQWRSLAPEQYRKTMRTFEQALDLPPIVVETGKPILVNWDFLTDAGSAVVRGGAVLLVKEWKDPRRGAGPETALWVLRNDGSLAKWRLPALNRKSQRSYLWPCGAGARDRIVTFISELNSPTPQEVWVDGKRWASRFADTKDLIPLSESPKPRF